MNASLDWAPALQHLQIEQYDKALVVTVNRPDKLNALNTEVLRELAAVLELVPSQPRTQIAGLVLTGAGDRAFIAGADIAEMSSMTAAEAEEFAALGQRVPDLAEGLDRPVIAAVNGYALGGGCEMALGCDFIYATESAKFGQPEVSLGLIACFGGCTRLPQRVGLGRARELITTGRMFSAAQAHEWGLVNAVYPDRDALIQGAVSTINEIATRAPRAVATSRVVINRAANIGPMAGLGAERAGFSEMFETRDAREGTAAFLAKRTPEFEDR